MQSISRETSVRRGIGIAATAALVALFAGCGGRDADAPDLWRFAIEETRGSVQDAYAQRFKELVEERSGGAVEVIVYPYGTLGTSDHVTEHVAMGAIEFAMASPGHLGKLIPEVQAFLLHFLLSDDEEINNRALGDPELITHLDAFYAEKGLALLSVFSEGWMVWTTQKPVRSPEDFRGVKIRVMTSPMLLAAYRAYGASPTPLSYGEVYSALQLNMIDAQVNPVFAIQEMSFYEVVDYLIFAGHAPFIATATANRAFLEGLPEEQRQMVREITEELDPYILEVQQRFNRERLEAMRDAKPALQVIDDFSDAERAAFRDASQAVRELFVQSVGPSGEETLQRIEDALERARLQQE